MGARINFTSCVSIAAKTWSNGPISRIGYNDITEDVKKDIAGNQKIHTIQVDRNLPLEAFKIIDEILALREDLEFRIFGLYDGEYFDLDALETMKHLTRLRIDCVRLTDHPNCIEPQKLCKLNGLKSIHIEVFDLMDYGFIQKLDKGIEEFSVYIDTMRGTPNFDCKWLLDFPQIHTLFIGKKAKKNFKCIAGLPNLKRLALRGIKIDNFYFLQNTDLEVLRILWASVEDMDSMAILKGLKQLELWRIPKLDDISVIRELKNLEVLKLQDLKHITALPDVSELPAFRELILWNTPVAPESVPDKIAVFSEQGTKR